MSEQEFENYLGLLGRFLRLDAGQREEIRRELRAHLDEAVEANLAAGMSRDEAVRQALDDFGDAAELADRFGKIGRNERWFMKGTAIAAVVAWLGFMGTQGLTSSEGPQQAGSATVAEVLASPRSATAAPVDKSGAAKASESEAANRVPPTDNAEVARRLSKGVLAEVNFNDWTIERGIEFIAKSVDVNYHFMRDELDTIGADLSRSITCNLRNVQPEAMMQILIAEAGNDSGLSYRVENGILLIGSKDGRPRRLETRCYDISDLLAMRAAVADQVPGGLGNNDAREEFCRTLRRVVSPESWVGGTSGVEGDLSMFGATVAVYQTADIHVQVEAFLHDLRSVAASTTAPASASAAR